MVCSMWFIVLVYSIWSILCGPILPPAIDPPPKTRPKEAPGLVGFFFGDAGFYDWGLVMGYMNYQHPPTTL